MSKTAKKKHIYSLINQYLASGSLHNVGKLINKYEKLSPLSTMEKVNLSIWYVWIGELDRAKKTLGKLRAKSEFPNLTLFELARQSRVAYIYYLLGARYIGKKIHSYINEVLAERNETLQKVYPKFYHQLGNIYIGSYEYENSKKNYEIALQHIPEESIDYHLCRLGLSDALSGLNQGDTARTIMADEIDYFRKNSCMNNLLSFAIFNYGETLFMDERCDEALPYFEQAEELLPKDKNTKEAAFLYKFYGATHLIQGDQSQAKKYLERALEILISRNAQAISTLSVVYWLEQLLKEKLDFKYKALLRLHFDYSPYKFLVGRKPSNLNKTPLHPWFQKRLPKFSCDAWIVKKESINPASYQESDVKIDIDLYAGVYLDEMRKLKHLSSIESAALIAVWGAGILGINERVLADFVYQEDFYRPEQGTERIKKLVQQLGKKGFKIKKEKGTYSANFPMNKSIIFPMAVLSAGKWAYLKKHFKDKPFKRTDVEKIFNTTKSTASRWIKEWVEREILSTTTRNSYVFND